MVNKSGTMRKIGIKPWDECDRMEKSCAEVFEGGMNVINHSSRFSGEVTGCRALAAIVCLIFRSVRILHSGFCEPESSW